MIDRNQIVSEIENLDERYLDLLYKIVRQFPRASESNGKKAKGRQIAAILQEIADEGGLRIESPQEWQSAIRRDRPLPFRKN